MSGRIPEASRLLRLKEQRLDATRLALALAVRAVRAAEEALARRDAAIAALDQRRARMDAWFAAPPPDPRLIETGLACRDHIAQQRAEQEQARLEETAALEAAEARRAEAAQEVARAQARRDGADEMLSGLKRALGRRRERQAEHELEERHAGAGVLA